MGESGAAYFFSGTKAVFITVCNAVKSERAGSKEAQRGEGPGVITRPFFVMVIGTMLSLYS